MVTAGVAFPVVGIVVAAAGIGVKQQNAVCKGLGSFVSIAGDTAVDSNTGLCQCHPGAAADAAADQSLDLMLSQQASQCAMTAGAGTNHHRIHYLTAFNGVDLESGGMTKCWKIFPFS